MKNVIELSSVELETIRGGATFAYRVGQCIRWMLFSQSGSPVLCTIRNIEMQYML